MKRRKYICIGLLIFLISIISIRIFLNQMQKKVDTKIVDGMVTDYTYYDRKISAEDFLQFDHNTTYEEMVECIGIENGRWGYGGAWPYYEMVHMQFAAVYQGIE